MQDSLTLPLPSSLPDLTGQTALITGTTSGLGRRFAWVLAKAGAKVALTGRRTDRLKDLEAHLLKEKCEAGSFALDLLKEEDIARVVEEVEGALGPITLLVNNSGINAQGAALDLSASDYDRVMDTNVRGAFLVTQAVARRLIAQGKSGRIINIASIGAHRVLPRLAAYCTSKAAVAMMTKALAREWARNDISVNAICPGYIETELNSEWFQSEPGIKQIKGFPKRRIGNESDLDQALLFLADPAARFTTGAILTVDDAQSLA